MSLKECQNCVTKGVATVCHSAQDFSIIVQSFLQSIIVRFIIELMRKCGASLSRVLSVDCDSPGIRENDPSIDPRSHQVSQLDKKQAKLPNEQLYPDVLTIRLSISQSSKIS